MFKRLQDYVFLPNRSKRSADRWALAIAISFGWYSVLSGVPGIDAAKQGLVIVIAAMVASTCWHLIAKAGTLNVIYKPDALLLRRPILTSLLGALMVGLAVSVRHIEAASIDRRLRRALADSSSVSEIARIANDALESNVAANPSIVDEVVRKSIERRRGSPTSRLTAAWL